MSKKNGIKVAVGILGVITSVVGGIILARRSRVESKEELIAKIRDIYGIYNEEFRDKYFKVRNAVEKKILDIKESGITVNQDKYVSVVDEIINNFKKDFTVTSDNTEKLGKHLKKEWGKIKKMIA